MAGPFICVVRSVVYARWKTLEGLDCVRSLTYFGDTTFLDNLVVPDDNAQCPGRQMVATAEQRIVLSHIIHMARGYEWSKPFATILCSKNVLSG